MEVDGQEPPRPKAPRKPPPLVYPLSIGEPAPISDGTVTTPHPEGHFEESNNSSSNPLFAHSPRPTGKTKGAFKERTALSKSTLARTPRGEPPPPSFRALTRTSSNLKEVAPMPLPITTSSPSLSPSTQLRAAVGSAITLLLLLGFALQHSSRYTTSLSWDNRHTHLLKTAASVLSGQCSAVQPLSWTPTAHHRKATHPFSTAPKPACISVSSATRLKLSCAQHRLGAAHRAHAARLVPNLPAHRPLSSPTSPSEASQASSLRSSASLNRSFRQGAPFSHASAAQQPGCQLAGALRCPPCSLRPSAPGSLPRARAPGAHPAADFCP